MNVCFIDDNFVYCLYMPPVCWLSVFLFLTHGNRRFEVVNPLCLFVQWHYICAYEPSLVSSADTTYIIIVSIVKLCKAGKGTACKPDLPKFSRHRWNGLMYLLKLIWHICYNCVVLHKIIFICTIFKLKKTYGLSLSSCNDLADLG